MRFRNDLLQWPFIGRLLRWRWGRLAFQIPLSLILLLIIYDGFTGPQLAASNNATVLAWVHYRGFVILLLLFAGNFFCMACPFTLPRTIARRLSIRGRRWPAFMRNKWVAIFMLFLIFWLYEWLDLWASPALTAWVAVAYLIVSFLLELIFRESAFCKYVCPLGSFNFVYAEASPTQITARELAVCQTCEGKECVNGSLEILGCGTELFVPTIKSNMDCTFCLDCARACPYDNVSLHTRLPGVALLNPSKPARWDLAFLLMAIAFMGLSNAFGMVPPVYALQAWLEGMGLRPEAIRLLAFFGSANLLLPALLLVSLPRISGLLAGSKDFKTIAADYTHGFVPIGLAIWLAHYGFHLAIGGAAILPVFQSFLLDHGIGLLGIKPNWELSFLLPQGLIFPIQVISLVGGFAASLLVLGRIALRRGQDPQTALRELLPWAIVIALLAIAALSIFNLPMEMRGTRMIGT